MTQHAITAPGGTTYDFGSILSAARTLRDQMLACERQAQLWCWEDKLKTKKTNRPNYRELILPLLAWHLNHGGTLPVGRAARAQHGIDAATVVVKTLIDLVESLTKACEDLKAEHAKDRADRVKTYEALRAELDAANKLKDIREAEAKESREVLRGALEIVVSRLDKALAVPEAIATELPQKKIVKLVRQAHGFASLVLDAEREKHVQPLGAGLSKTIRSIAMLAGLGGYLYPAMKKSLADAGEAAPK